MNIPYNLLFQLLNLLILLGLLIGGGYLVVRLIKLINLNIKKLEEKDD